jgi:hypothetical protein
VMKNHQVAFQAESRNDLADIPVTIHHLFVT